MVGFKKPETFPDFTECDQTTPEDNQTWKTIIHEGGKGGRFPPSCVIRRSADAEQIGMAVGLPAELLHREKSGRGAN